MDKPVKQTKEYYDYHECSRYLEQKYGYNERDVAGRWKFQKELKGQIDAKYGTSWYYTTRKDATFVELHALQEYADGMLHQPPNLDFWGWMTDFYDVSNGCFVTFQSENKTGTEDWVNQIYQYYIKEFADENGTLIMEVSW
jgi:hypothetical protein